MDKPDVQLGDLEGELVERVIGCVDSNSPIGIRSEAVLEAVKDYREKVESGLWEGWDLAQAFNFDQAKTTFEDRKGHLDRLYKDFYRAVGAYNREREREGKPEHKFDCPEAEAAQPDNKAKPVVVSKEE